MDKVKVFATSEAYKELNDFNNEENTKHILNDLQEQITKKRSRTPDSYHNYSSFGISARWADDSSKTSVVLIYYSQDILGLRHFNFPETFWEDISKGVPFEFA